MGSSVVAQDDNVLYTHRAEFVLINAGSRLEPGRLDSEKKERLF